MLDPSSGARRLLPPLSTERSERSLAVDTELYGGNVLVQAWDGDHSFLYCFNRGINEWLRCPVQEADPCCWQPVTLFAVVDSYLYAFSESFLCIGTEVHRLNLGDALRKTLPRIRSSLSYDQIRRGSAHLANMSVLWEPLPPLHIKRASASVTCCNGKIYVLGGYPINGSSQDLVSSGEMWNPNSLNPEWVLGPELWLSEFPKPHRLVTAEIAGKLCVVIQAAGKWHIMCYQEDTHQWTPLIRSTDPYPRSFSARSIDPYPRSFFALGEELWINYQGIFPQEGECGKLNIKTTHLPTFSVQSYPIKVIRVPYNMFHWMMLEESSSHTTLEFTFLGDAISLSAACFKV